MFEIRFVSSPEVDEGTPVMPGEISLGGYWESFRAPLGFWSVADYEQHWRAAAQRLVQGAASTAFFTSVAGDDRPYEFWWPMWRCGEAVFVQEHLLFKDQLAGPLDYSDPYSHVPVRCTVSEDGDPISEWIIRLTDVEGFLTRSAPGA